MCHRDGGSTPGKHADSTRSVQLTRWSRYGTVYLFMQLVPPFSMFFLMTAAVSSGLWAADLERTRREQEAQITQSPVYTDEPDATV